MTYAVHSAVKAIWPVFGTDACKIAIVGGAPSGTDAMAGDPFQGAPGAELAAWMTRAGYDLSTCLITNVFSFKPPQDNVAKFYMQKPAAKKIKKASGWESPFPHFPKHGYLKEEHEHDIARLAAEINEANPNVILVLGGAALWAVTGLSPISTYRGTACRSVESMGSRKVIPTYHPDAVIKNWSLRPLALMDIHKAIAESSSPDLVFKERTIWTEPLLSDLSAFEARYIEAIKGTAAPLAFDIETDRTGITCIGFAPSDREAIVVPFKDKRMPDYSYWPGLSQEIKAWAWVKHILEDTSLVKLAHNQSYDVTWLTRLGIKVSGPIEDTYHIHHAMQPEMPKALGVLSSLYTNAQSWKGMVKHEH
jgi:uracil-DNA glycosylase